MSAYALSDCVAGIHAAAVSGGAECLLLPGAPGSGKSALAAALMSEGLACLADELVLLGREPHWVQPIPMSLGMKAGSWPLLETRFTEFAALPIHLQADGTQVRYVAPSVDYLSGRKPYPVGAIVFPQYDSDQPMAGPKKIRTAEALYRLAESGYAVPGGLDASVVRQLVSWIDQVDCYSLNVSDLPTAISQIRALLA